MTKFRKLEKREYQELSKQALFTTFFHNVEWHEFLEKEFKWLKFEYYLYKQEVILPLAIIEKKMISLPFCEYGGPLLVRRSLGEGGPENINFEQFEKDVVDEFGDNIKIKFHPRIINPTGKAELSSSALSSHWLTDLKFENEAWDSLRKTLKHEIKHAQEQGLEIRASKNPKELKKFYDLYTANLRRKKTVPYPWHLVQFLCQNPSNELLLAFYKGRIIGGDLFLNYDGFVHYFLSATDYKYRSFGAAHLILWEEIKSLIGQGKILDLGASPRGSALEIFKRGWGGTEYPIYQIGIKRTEESLRSLKLIRFIFGLLPNCIIKKLSPYLIKYRL